MSAFLCTSAHIDVIVQGNIEFGKMHPADGDHYGTLLLRENYESLAARYGGRSPEEIGYRFHGFGTLLLRENYESLAARYGGRSPEEIGYRFHGIEAPLDPAVVLAAVRSYVYQFCEHEHGTMRAEALTAPLEHRLREALAAAGVREAWDEHYSGDTDRGWFITDQAQAVRRSPAGHGEVA